MTEELKTFFECEGCNKVKPIEQKHHALLKCQRLHERSEAGRKNASVYTQTYHVWLCDDCYGS